MDVDVGGVVASFRAVADTAAAGFPEEAQLIRERIADAGRGKAPTRTGALRGSIRANAQGIGILDYGRFTEFGTRYVRATPYMRPAVAKAEAGVQEIYEDAVGRLIDQHF